MTKEEFIKKIDAEIAKLSDNASQMCEEDEGYRLACKDISDVFHEIAKKIQPSLPSNLDEAAKKAYKEYDVKTAVKPKEHPVGFLFFDGFKAGAEWMAGQGIKLRGRILPGPRCNLYIESDCFDRGYKGLNYRFSDSNDVDMFVQIRKK